MNTRRLASTLLLSSLLFTLGAGCSGKDAASSIPDVKLTYWRTFDNSDTMSDIITAYTTLHPNVSIDYKKLRSDEYDDALLHAFASGTGPDIFSVHNSTMGEYQSLLLPEPATTTIPYLEMQGTLRKQAVVVTKVLPTVSIKTLKSNFVDTVAEDVVFDYQPDPKVAAEPRVYGLPLSVDTLALFANKDLLNAASIAAAPTSWEEFHDDVVKLTKLDSTGNIIQSGAGFGTSENVNRAVDILSVLMMQNGTEMTDSRGRITFQTVPNGTPRDLFPALDATTFYTDFANPTKDAYTWNDSFPSSFDAFTAGQTAFYFGYSYDLPLIRTAAPKLNFTVNSLPQITNGREVNYPNYWIESVSKDTKNADWAWDFINFATNKDNVTSYLNKAQKPTALRSLISSQLESEDLGVFAEQLLLAKSWYHGQDTAAMETAMNSLIDIILLGTNDPSNAIETTARIVSQTYNQ
jgi:ABC-type glycerol-3-phosphate transport system substrate-binding protein